MATSTTIIPARSVSTDQLPRFTGKKIILLNSSAKTSLLLSQAKKASLNFASTADFRKSKTTDFLTTALMQADGIIFDTLKVAIINEALDEPLNRLMATSAAAKNFLLTEPERFLYAFMAGKKKFKKTSFTDNATATWAMQAVNALKSKYTGKGSRVAVLDTGIDISHADLKARVKARRSFVTGQLVTDLNGHGTHCSGLVAGNIHATKKFRYGVAPETSLYIGKVLSNDGVGTDSSILAGIEWALQNNCQVISMSLGGAALPGETYSAVYESVAREALNKNCLIVAAAGNESERSRNKIAPVGHPANCPSIFAVAALTSSLGIADFSCGGINPDGGQIDIAAPGENIWSAWKNKAYRRESGTSMATPIVAGLASLLLQANPKTTAAGLWMKLSQQAKRLPLPATDAGAGLAYHRE
jgi:subtilisin